MRCEIAGEAASASAVFPRSERVYPAIRIAGVQAYILEGQRPDARTTPADIETISLQRESTRGS